MAVERRARATPFQKRRALAMAALQTDVAGQLFRRREECGLTEQQVADAMGSTQEKVSDFERGETNATYDYVARYAAAVGMIPKVHFVPVTKLPIDQEP
jgi:transcriptional regulator with XRE-family HTH domain